MGRARDIAALLLALGVATTIIIIGAQEFTHNGNISPDEATVFSTVLGAAIGAVAAYLGSDRKGGS